MDAARRAGYLGALGGHWGEDSVFNRARYDAGGAGPAWFAAEVLGWLDRARRLKRGWLGTGARTRLVADRAGGGPRAGAAGAPGT